MEDTFQNLIFIMNTISCLHFFQKVNFTLIFLEYFTKHWIVITAVSSWNNLKLLRKKDYFLLFVCDGGKAIVTNPYFVFIPQRRNCGFFGTTFVTNSFSTFSTVMLKDKNIEHEPCRHCIKKNLENHRKYEPVIWCVLCF